MLEVTDNPFQCFPTKAKPVSQRSEGFGDLFCQMPQINQGVLEQSPLNFPLQRICHSEQKEEKFPWNGRPCMQTEIRCRVWKLNMGFNLKGQCSF